MTVQTVFRSNQQEVIDVHNQWKAGRDKFMEFIDDLEAEFGRDAMFTRAAATGNKVVGFRASDEDQEAPPKGLRFDNTYRCLVPNKSTTLGKKLVKRFTENINPRPDYPGMGHMAIGGGLAGMQMFYPGFEEIDGWIYALWGCDEASVPQVDTMLWERVRLSEWYALKGD